jgi:ketosteroid isomerase-like protein
MHLVSSPAPDPVALMRELLPREIDMVGFVNSGGELWPHLLHRVSPDLVIEFFPEALGGRIEGAGVQGMVEGWREWLEPYEAYVTAIEDLEELPTGDILILVHARARTHRDGVEVEHSPAAVATVRDGLLQRMRFYLDRDEARAAEPG